MGRFFFASITLLTILIAGLLGGAAIFEWSDLTGGVGLGVALGTVFIASFVLPLLFSARLLRGRTSVRPVIVTLTTLLGWNGLAAGLAIGLAPGAVRQMLAHHGTWMMPAPIQPPAQALLDRGLALWPTSTATTAEFTPPEAVVHVEDTAPSPAIPSSPTASVAVAATPVPPVEETTPELTPETETLTPSKPEKPWNARQLFRHRADTVVVIEVQTRKKMDESFADLMGFKSSKDGYVWVDGGGSGFFVSKDGLLVTNHHVLGDAGRARVTLRDGRRFDDVHVLVSQPEHDLVLARIDVKGVAYTKIADRPLDIGEPAYAIGSPLNLRFTLTQGIVSAERDVQGTRFLQMQTDVAPGSSGGPLFDEWGQVIGVNTAVRGPGMNFAVDRTHVKALLEAERSVKELVPYVEGVRVTDLNVEGAKILPTDRMILMMVLKFMGQHFDRCIHALPEAAQVEMHVDSERLTSNLSEEAQRCLKKQRRSVTRFSEFLVKRSLRNETPVRLTTRFEGLSVQRADEAYRSLTFRIHRGDTETLNPVVTATVTQTASVAD